MDRVYLMNLLEIILTILLINSEVSHSQVLEEKNLFVGFDGKYGQVEVGGNYVGAEFHNSRPLPSRISFYYPVANSIDLSKDYWKREESEPFKILVNVDNKTDTIGTEPCYYKWTPYEADFTYYGGTYFAEISYEFCDDIPFMVIRMKFINQSRGRKTFHIRTSLTTILRTCQTYAWKDTGEVQYVNWGNACFIDFKYPDTDSASVIVASAGDVMPANNPDSSRQIKSIPVAEFSYSKSVESSGKFTIVQIIGSSRIAESREMLTKALRLWKESIWKNKYRILNYVYHAGVVSVPDRNLQHTDLWSKAMLASDRHYINGSVVPMPCPAEYNFFFTHDVLLTDLGAVFYDLPRVRDDLLFIRSLTRPDSILPHAYYWRDDGFKTEFASKENWNHLWFMIVCGSYLKHSGDIKTLKLIYPILKKSVEMALSNLGPGGLMYSRRPDWWDIGNNYGARSYLTALMVRALREYCYVALKLQVDDNFARTCLNTSNELQRNLVSRLWNTKVGYLLNTIDTGSVDYHYYAGSLVAVYFDLLDREMSDSLIATAQRELLDPNLGIRNAMPDDFDRLSSLYEFKEGEAGGPYVYMNGAVWPHTTSWYILGLIELGRLNRAREALDRYLTVEGIRNSPNGQPSFFEYRFSDPSSPFYGKIDKPNFLWGGGWYLNTLYHLLGVREDRSNIYLTPNVPDGFDNMEYDVAVHGDLSKVVWKGKGTYFKKIIADGRDLHSAVIYNHPRRILVKRGMPESPYLESATCVVDSVKYVKKTNTLSLELSGFIGEGARVNIISPLPLKKALFEKQDSNSKVISTEKDGVYVIGLEFTFVRKNERVEFEF